MGSNPVVITFQGQNQLSPVLQAMTQALTGLQASLGQTTQHLQQLGATSQQLSTTHQAVTQALQQQAQAYTQVGQAAQQAAQQAQASHQIFQQVFAVAGGVGLATSVQALTSQFLAFGKSVIETGARLESLRVGITAVVGSVQEGQRAYQFLFDTGQRLGVSTATLAETFRSFAAATRGTSLEGEQTKRIYESLVIAGRALGSSNEQIKSGLLALEQIVSKGTVSMEELRRQLGNAIPGAFQIAARANAMTTEELTKFVATGEAQAIPFVLKFGEQLRKEFAGGAEAAAKTASVAFTQLANEWEALKERLAKSGPLRLTVEVVRVLSGFLQSGRLADDQVQSGLERTVGQARIPVAPGVTRPGTLEGATDDEMAQLRRLQGLLTERQQNPVGFPFNRLGATQAPQIQEQITQILGGIAQRRFEQQGIAARQADTSGEDPLRAQAQTAKEAEEANKKLADEVANVRKEYDKLVESSKRYGAVVGSPTGTEDQRILFLQNERKKLEEGLEKTMALEGQRTSAMGPIPADTNAALMKDVARIAEIDDEINKIKELRKEREAAEREAEQNAEHAREGVVKARLAEQQATQEAVEALKKLAAQYLETKAARDVDTAAALVARTANDENAYALAKEYEAAIQLGAALKDKAAAAAEDAERTKAAGLAAVQAATAQTEYDQSLQNTLERLGASPDERAGTRARQRAPGGIVTADQATQISLINAKELAEQQAKDLDTIYRGVGRSIEQSITGAFEQGFSNGAISGKQFALGLLQGIQRLFLQLSTQLANQALNLATGSSQQSGGWAGVLAGVLSKVITGAIGGGASGGDYALTNANTTGGVPVAEGGIIPAIQSLASAGMRLRRTSAAMQPLHKAFGELQPVAMAAGGIVRQPSFAILGEKNTRQFEAVVPLPDNRSIPVTLSERSGSSQVHEPQPIVIQLMQDFRGSVDPRSLRTTPSEVIRIVAKDISNDGPTRRLIIRHATR